MFRNTRFFNSGIIFIFLFISISVSCENGDDITDEMFLSSFLIETESSCNCKALIWKEDLKTKTTYTITLEYSTSIHSKLPFEIESKSKVIAGEFIKRFDYLKSNVKIVVNHDLVKLTKAEDYTSTKVLESYSCDFTIGAIPNDCFDY